MTLENETQNTYKNLDKKLDHIKHYKKTEKTTSTPHKFYSRVINNTNIIFSENELTILNKGLKYNFNPKPKNWITALALEAETAINQLPPPEQDPIRYQVTKNIQKLYTQFQTHDHHNIRALRKN